MELINHFIHVCSSRESLPGSWGKPSPARAGQTEADIPTLGCCPSPAWLNPWQSNWQHSRWGWATERQWGRDVSGLPWIKGFFSPFSDRRGGQEIGGTYLREADVGDIQSISHLKASLPNSHFPKQHVDQPVESAILQNVHSYTLCNIVLPPSDVYKNACARVKCAQKCIC